METSTLTLDTPDGPMPLYEAEPDGPPKGAVVVVQEAFGVNPHIEDVTRRFAAAGYHAVAPHLFHRTGSPVLGYDDFAAVMPHITPLSDDGLLVDVTAALDHLRAAGWSDRQIGIVGFCMGGRVTFLVAGHEALGAAVGFYGGGIVTGRSEAMPALLDLVPGCAPRGWACSATPTSRSRSTTSSSSATCSTWGPTSTRRSCATRRAARLPLRQSRDSYDEASARDAWHRTLEWLDVHLAPSD